MLNARVNGAVLAAAVVDKIFRNYRLLSDEELAALRQAGASNQEIILAAVITNKTRKPASRIYLEVKLGSTTWGALLQQAKIEPKNMAQAVSGMLESQAKK
jgi:hypothetical protein